MKLLAQSQYEEKRSKFIAFLYEVESEEDAKNILNALKEEHPKARHILRVLRYENKFGAMVSEASEDREPISSMKKVKTFLERDNVKNKGIYVVRYYGGTQLGASHLDHVYFTMAMKLLGKKE